MCSLRRRVAGGLFELIKKDSFYYSSLPRVEGRLEEAVGVSMSEWHVIFAFPSRIVAISIYTHAAVYENKCSSVGRFFYCPKLQSY